PKTCVENEQRPRCPLQGDLPLTTSQELIEGSPRVTFLSLIPFVYTGANGTVQSKGWPDYLIGYDTALVDLFQVDRWFYVTSVRLLLNSVADNLAGLSVTSTYL
ncbi:hypothetical protein AX16_009805, partial [Volvariella volvacea WC 439]